MISRVANTSRADRTLGRNFLHNTDAAGENQGFQA
jgi:hypothetical protein